MTRGQAHPAELRAQVVAAIIAGATVAEVARRYSVSKSMVSRWAAANGTVATLRETNQRTPEVLEAMLFDLVAEHIQTIRTQLQTVASPGYLQKQTAGELAQLLGTERDTLIRLLAGFRPIVPDQHALDDGSGPSS